MKALRVLDKKQDSQLEWNQKVGFFLLVWAAPKGATIWRTDDDTGKNEKASAEGENVTVELARNKADAPWLIRYSYEEEVQTRFKVNDPAISTQELAKKVLKHAQRWWKEYSTSELDTWNA